MAILMDSGFFLALCHPKDKDHNDARRLFFEMAEGQHGLLFTTPYVISESATLMLVRTENNTALLQDFYDLLYGPEKCIRILPWKEDLEQRIWTFFFAINRKAENRKEWLSFVDCSNIILAQEHNIPQIVAYDGHFSPFLHNLALPT